MVGDGRPSYGSRRKYESSNYIKHENDLCYDMWQVHHMCAEQVWGSILFSIFISIYILFSTNYFQIFEIRLFDIKQSYNYIPAHLIYDIMNSFFFYVTRDPQASTVTWLTRPYPDFL